MFERRGEKVIPHTQFVRRMGRMLLCALTLMGASLALGVMGYRFTEEMDWIDALLNAAMILGGMGPVDTLHSDGGKLFASFYALYSGLVLIAVMGVFMGPIVHRVLHTFHAEPDEDEEEKQEDEDGQAK